MDFKVAENRGDEKRDSSPSPKKSPLQKKATISGDKKNMDFKNYTK